MEFLYHDMWEVYSFLIKLGGTPNAGLVLLL